MAPPEPASAAPPPAPLPRPRPRSAVRVLNGGSACARSPAWGRASWPRRSRVYTAAHGPTLYLRGNRETRLRAGPGDASVRPPPGAPWSAPLRPALPSDRPDSARALGRGLHFKGGGPREGLRGCGAGLAARTRTRRQVMIASAPQQLPPRATCPPAAAEVLAVKASLREGDRTDRSRTLLGPHGSLLGVPKALLRPMTQVLGVISMHRYKCLINSTCSPNHSELTQQPRWEEVAQASQALCVTPERREAGPGLQLLVCWRRLAGNELLGGPAVIQDYR